jgi:hypothetical protein
MHVQRPRGVLKYSCRFQGELLQFPAICRTQANTLNFTFSESRSRPGQEAAAVDTWRYTWTCSSNPSIASSGSATFVADTPEGKVEAQCVYFVEQDHDGPALVFRPKQGVRDKEDRIVWHRKYFGPQIYKSATERLTRLVQQDTYRPADERIKKQIAERPTRQPEKPSGPDARDGLDKSGAKPIRPLITEEE